MRSCDEQLGTLPRSRDGDGRRRLFRDVRRPGARDPLRLGDRRAVRALGLEVRPACTPASASSIGGNVAGIAVHIGARVGALAEPGEVLVSQTVKDLVAGSGLEFDDRGVAQLKGVPGEWRLYSVSG